MNYRHSNAHNDLQIANNGITFDVEGGQAWFSADRFERESEQITLRTAPNGKTFYRDDAASLVQFTGV